MLITDEIITGCKKGQSKAQKHLVQQSAPHLMRVALRYTHDHPSAQDVLQDSYIKIFSKINTFKKEKGQFNAWVRSIVIYTAIEKYRRKYWKNELNNINKNNFNEPQVSFDWDQRIDTQKIYAVIDQLPIGLKTVFNLFVIEEYAHKEIAQLLNIKASTSRSQLTRARQMLQKILIQLEIV